jgi:broad specificity phosphatase PhoE
MVNKKIPELAQESHVMKDAHEVEKVKEDWKLVTIDGTHMSGFVNNGENQMPRQCHNCIWYKDDKCHHPVVMVDEEVPGDYGKPKSVADDSCCGFFRSPKRDLLYILRHGEDEYDDLIGGWEDADIDEAGIKDAKEAAAFLKNKGIRHIYCSDMKRCMETSKIVAKELNLDPYCIVTDVRLRTWNKGIYNGQEKTEQNKEDLQYYRENPHKIIPNGESHYQFEDRSDEAMAYYIHKARSCGIILIVTHNSLVKQAQRFVKESRTGKEVNSANGPMDSVMPGGILKLHSDWDKLAFDIVLKEGKK